jgi:hypothetical protein
MRLEPITAFATWASSRGIEIEERTVCEGRRENSLRFRAATSQDRYWVTHYENKHLLVFVTALLVAASPWEFCWVLKREGGWDDMDEGEGLELVLRSLEIPRGFDGAIQFSYEQRAALTMLIVAQIAFGWCGYYDIWVVPDHGRQMIRTDDDDITAVLFTDEPSLSHFVKSMSTAGFELPNAPPSKHFYWQPWMGPKPPDWEK